MFSIESSSPAMKVAFFRQVVWVSIGRIYNFSFGQEQQ